jgi:DNA-binding protein WhiA
LAAFDLKAKSVARRDTQTVYLKGAEQLSVFLNIVGAHRALLQLESLRVTRDVRNQTNGRVICDNAKFNKAVDAAMRQTADIQYIIENIGFETLPKNLRIAAELRLDNPEANLGELAELSGLGRSALNHRLRRLAEIAENIRVYGPEEWDKD